MNTNRYKLQSVDNRETPLIVSIFSPLDEVYPHTLLKTLISVMIAVYKLNIRNSRWSLFSNLFLKNILLDICNYCCIQIFHSKKIFSYREYDE